MLLGGGWRGVRGLFVVVVVVVVASVHGRMQLSLTRAQVKPSVVCDRRALFTLSRARLRVVARSKPILLRARAQRIFNFISNDRQKGKARQETGTRDEERARKRDGISTARDGKNNNKRP